MRATRHTFAHEVHTVTHIVERIYTLHLVHVRFIVHKIRIRLDGRSHRLEVSTLFEFHIHHTAVNASAERNRHRQSIAHTVNGTHSHRVPHGATRAKVRVAHTLWSQTFDEGAHHRVRTRVPTCRNHAHSTVSLGSCIERTTQIHDLRVDVEGVHCVNAQCKALFGINFHLTSGSSEDGHIHIFKFCNVFHHRIFRQLSRLFTFHTTAHHTSAHHVARSLDSFERIFTNVAITHDGSANFLFHIISVV